MAIGGMASSSSLMTIALPCPRGGSATYQAGLSNIPLSNLDECLAQNSPSLELENSLLISVETCSWIDRKDAFHGISRLQGNRSIDQERTEKMSVCHVCDLACLCSKDLQQDVQNPHPNQGRATAYM